MIKEIINVQIPLQHAGYRLDQSASLLIPQYSRNKIRQCIVDGSLVIDNNKVKPSYKLYGDEILTATFMHKPVIKDAPEKIELEVVYKDEHIIVINKPAGLVTHPAVGNYQGTLLNALLYFDPSLSQLPRAGIVHRLDKNTSGLLVISRTEQARQSLISQLQDRSMSRKYIALCRGLVKSTLTIDKPIGRHPVDRKKMAVISGGKEAKTICQPIEHIEGYTLVDLKLTSGRTHQIRVHMHSMGYPLIGDSTYGGKSQAHDPSYIAEFTRQALHAYRLSFKHPETGEIVKWQIPIADDILKLLEQLKHKQP